MAFQDLTAIAIRQKFGRLKKRGSQRKQEHLPGKHDQKKHAHKGAGSTAASGGPKVDGKPWEVVEIPGSRGSDKVTLGPYHGKRFNDFDSEEPSMIASPDDIENLGPAADFGPNEKDDEYLYHVTDADAAEEMQYSGITIGNKPTFGGVYDAHSKDKAFLTERSGVFFWDGKVETALFDSHDDPPEVQVVRVKKDKVRGTLQTDRKGTRDAGHDAYFIEKEEGQLQEQQATRYQEFNPNQPRAKDGKFIDMVKIADAAKDVGQAKKLMQTVTAKDRAKFTKELKAQGMSAADVKTVRASAPSRARKPGNTKKTTGEPAGPKSTKSKAAIAKASHKHTDKKVQDHAAANERWVAEQFGHIDSKLFGDSAPSDVDTKHGHIEIKTMKHGANGKLTMNLYAQVLKVNMEKETKQPFHTLVIDDTKPGTRGFFYRRGIAGSARMTAMHPASSMQELETLMAMAENELPPPAQRSDAKLFVGDWVPVAPGERAFRNTVTGKIAKPKK